MRCAQAPFGRVGRALGFRWVFPIGTMPIPYHPLIRLAFVIGIPAALAFEIARTVAGFGGGGEGGRWMVPLFAALALGIPLSIPIVSWAMMVFLAPLLQGVLIGGSMLLLSAEIASGYSDPRLGVLPVAYVALFLVQFLGGPIYVRRLQAGNAAFAPVEPGARTIVVEGDSIAGSYGHWLLRHCDVAQVHVLAVPRRSNPVKARQYLHLSPADVERVAALIDHANVAGWSIDRKMNVLSVPAEGVEPDPAAVHLRFHPHRAPLALVTGTRVVLEVSADGRIRRWVGGDAAVIGPVPLFTAFYWMAIFGGQSRWHVGFARKKPVALGTARLYDMIAATFPAQPQSGPTRFADPSSLISQLEQSARERRSRAVDELEELLSLADCADWKNRFLPQHALHHFPEVMDGYGARICDALESARACKNNPGVVRYAQLLAALSASEYTAVGPRLITLLNSKELAARLVDGPTPPAGTSVKDIPPARIIGGYSLIKHVPSLYERLGELGEPARSLIFALGEMGRWPPAVVEARRRLERGSA